MQRRITSLIQGRATEDGAGVKLHRVLTPSMKSIDPFLLLDEIKSSDNADTIGGFPSHPHRGFETVSYMLQGSMRHKDHMGNEGLIEAGAVQWMTAGKGVIHSEMPELSEQGLHGFQLWINLPAHEKMKKAAYQEFTADSIPQASVVNQGQEIARARIIAGSFDCPDYNISMEGAVKNISTEAHYVDIFLKKNHSLALDSDASHCVLIYCFSGNLMIDDKLLMKGQLAQLSEGDKVCFYAQDDARFLFLSAQPIGEPVASYGPFVMNTDAEIMQAMDDYRHGRLTD